MKELSLNILDIVENSVKAKASLTEITINENDEHLIIIINDNGCGMSKQTLESVLDPFYTSRTTRKVGLGIPLLKLAAEQTGGYIEITSKSEVDFPDLHGTRVVAHFLKNHIDFTPLGDVISTVQTLVQGHPDVDFKYIHDNGHSSVSLDTREMREVLEDVPLDSYEVITWIGDNLKEQYANFKN